MRGRINNVASGEKREFVYMAGDLLPPPTVPHPNPSDCDAAVRSIDRTDKPSGFVALPPL